ncbi:Hypothetical Protein RRSL_04695 [Ralstonia solanacearum UW551]|uniref:Ig-like domain-containing protein n=1 Tax=Ralstonia solanacearum (strain UW551) TaxID=342110 RepID=A0AB33VJ54_RALSU|nr:Hypothetical Protein RRSL_04695 [Ralstonia solanacearum UW551]
MRSLPDVPVSVSLPDVPSMMADGCVLPSSDTFSSWPALAVLLRLVESVAWIVVLFSRLALMPSKPPPLSVIEPRNSLSLRLSSVPPSMAVIVIVDEAPMPRRPLLLTTLNCSPSSDASAESALNWFVDSRLATPP